MIREVKKHREIEGCLKLNDHWEVTTLLYFDRTLCVGHDKDWEGSRSVWFYFPDTPEVVEIINDFPAGKLSVDPYIFSKIYNEVKDIFYSYK